MSTADGNLAALTRLARAEFDVAVFWSIPLLPDPADDARNVDWFPVRKPPPLAFDHDKILEVACQRLRGKVCYQPIGFELLPRKFTLSELQRLYETVLGKRLDKRNFRRRVLETGVLEETAQTERDVAHRAARLYRFNKSKYQRLARRGFHFEI